MNTQQLHDALTGLDEELISSTARAREKKQVAWGPWVALAACACLVLALGVKAMPFFTLENAAPEDAGANDWLYGMIADSDTHKSESAHWDACMLTVQVTQVQTGRILVSPLEGQDIGQDSVISIPVSGEETYVVGDRLRIYHDGQILESWPLQLGKIYGVERIE